jgi:nucleosome assembly protein 1-like 1
VQPPPPDIVQLYEQIEAETDVAMELRNKVVPNALNWYTGVAAAEEEDMYGDDDDDEEEEEGDDDDDNDAESG